MRAADDFAIRGEIVVDPQSIRLIDDAGPKRMEARSAEWDLGQCSWCARQDSEPFAASAIGASRDACRPSLMVAAGRAGFDTVCEMLKPEWYLTKVISRGGSGGTYQWSANRGVFNDQEMVIVQLPHFSRANSPTHLVNNTGEAT